METIRITVHLHTIAQKWSEKGRINKINLEINHGCTIIELIKQLDIPLKWEDILVVIDQKTVSGDYQLRDSDEIHIIPAISGG
ncbi:MAG: MoaD/ThiS family protein [Anaerolineales bacterium]